MSTHLRLGAWCVIVWLGAALGAHGDVPAAPAGASAGSPRAALEAYILAGRAGQWDEAARYLDGGDATDARRLKVVLDRCLWVNFDALSDSPLGMEDDELPPALDRVGTVTAGELDVPIDVERGADGMWRFSGSTMEALPMLWSAHGYGPIVEMLPRMLIDTRVLEVAAWQWIAVALLLVAGWLAALVCAPLLEWVVRSASRDTGWQAIGWRMLNASRSGLRWFAALLVLRAGAGALELSVPAHDALRMITMAVGSLVAAWAISSAITGGAVALQERALAAGRQGMLAVIMLVRRTLQVLAWVLGVVIAATAAGFDMTGVLAGLGIGGIAISLAAQRTIENIFAGVSIVADQPVRVGDTCRIGPRVGTVERIGMRSVQLRSPERTLVTIPNSQFAAAEVESLAARDRMRLHMTIGLRYETSREEMVQVLQRCESLLKRNPRVLPEGIRVRFVGFGASSLDVEIQAFIGTRDWEEFLQARQAILLEIMEAVEGAGTGFAFPSSTVYLARDKAPAAESVGR
jgi:MscS family membrane protein